jgi:hypothetical protein
MGCKVTVEPEYLRAELFDRETAEETRAFFRSIGLQSKAHQRSRLLVHYRSSRSILEVDRHGLIELLLQLSRVESSHRIALVGDTEESRRSHEHVALLAQQRGLSVRSFHTEPLALLWLLERRKQQERRLPDVRHPQENQRPAENRRSLLDRRSGMGDPQPA